MKKFARVIVATTAFALLGLTAAAQETAPSQPSAGGAEQQRDHRASAYRKYPKTYRSYSRNYSRTYSKFSGKRMRSAGMWWKNPDLAQRLAITADQQKRMDDIFQQSRLQLIDLKANVEKAEVVLRPMLAANPPDTDAVLAQIDKIAQARADLEKANAKMLLGIRTVLTPDQWTKLQQERRRPSVGAGPGRRFRGGAGKPGGFYKSNG